MAKWNGLNRFFRILQPGLFIMERVVTSVGTFEFLEVTPAIREMVHAEVDDLSLRRKAIEGGMETLAENGFTRVRDGETTISEAINVCMVD